MIPALYIIILAISIREFASIKDEPPGSPKVKRTLWLIAALWIVPSAILVALFAMTDVGTWL